MDVGDQLEDNDNGGRSEQSSKSWDATHILRAQPTGIADRLRVEYEKERRIPVSLPENLWGIVKQFKEEALESSSFGKLEMPLDL